MHVDLYDGNDNLAAKMVEAGFAVMSLPSLDAVRYHQGVDSVTVAVPPTDDQLSYVLLPG